MFYLRAPALLSLAAVLAGCTAAPPAALPQEPAELAGRTPGPAQRCVPVETGEGLRYGADRLLLYGRGSLVWVNRLEKGCTGIRPTDVLVLRPLGNRYCRGDLVQSFDATSRTPGPGCRLGDFIPNRR